MLWIAFAVVFVIALFFIKNRSIFKNQEINQNQGLIYKNEIIGNLVNRDTDGDGIPDWEESLWGTDPTKKETTPGIPDSVAIEKLKLEQGKNDGTNNGTTNQTPETPTETDKFSRELLSTVTSLNQNGAMDQATVDKISNSLADHIQNSAPRKIFLLSDIKVIKDDTTVAIQKYNDALNSIYKKNQTNYTVIDVLQKFEGDGTNIDVNALSKLDPIITQTQGIINGVIKTDVPQSLASLDLDFINGLQRIVENLSDIKLYDTDVIVALSGISKYETNATLLGSAVKNLQNAIGNKLSN